MNAARHFLAIGLLTLAMPVHAAWDDSNIKNIIDNVQTIVDTVTGNVKTAADDFIKQKGKRPQDLLESVDDILTWIENRRTPFQDFVNGPGGRCGTGSPCASFRTDLRTFALQMADLKDRFPVFQQLGLGDTTFFAEVVKVLPPFVLFGLHEILSRVPDWKDLPVDLADIFDEIGDDEMFATTLDPSPTLAAAAIAGERKAALADTRITAVSGLDKTLQGPLTYFCSKGKEALIDNVRFNRLKGLVIRWKNRFDSFSEYGPDSATITLLGEGYGNLKPPRKPFLKTVSNALDSLHAQMETHRENLEECAKIEADVASRAPLAIYKTEYGVRTAYWVVQGVLARSSTKASSMDTQTAKQHLLNARTRYNNGNWRGAYGSICDAYAAL